MATKTQFKGYFQSGYGRRLRKDRSIYLIDGKLYAKDAKIARDLFQQNDITQKGYVPVNLDPVYGICHQVSLLKDHRSTETA